MRIAITGPSGSGKSFVSEMLRKKGYPVIDADKVAKDLRPSYEGEIVKLFGDEIVTEGHVDNKKLAILIFSNPTAKDALNKLLFPPIIAKIKELMDAEDGVVFVDVPILFKSGAVDLFDKILIITAPPEMRLKRLVEGRGIKPEIAEKQINSIVITDEEFANPKAYTMWNVDSNLNQIEYRIDSIINGRI